MEEEMREDQDSGAAQQDIGISLGQEENGQKSEVETAENTGPEETDPAGRAEELERRVSALAADLQARDDAVTRLKEQLASTAARYRAALLASAPEVPEELVQGSTIEELDAAMASARKIVEKIARQVESQAASERVPAGSPPRRPADLSAMSPKEKILYALQRG